MMKRILMILVCLPLLTAGMCAGDSAAVKIETVEVIKEVQKPCPGPRPTRPEPLPAILPTDAIQLAALLGAKLAEYAAPGKYADRAEAIFDRCLDAAG